MRHSWGSSIFAIGVLLFSACGDDDGDGGGDAGVCSPASFDAGICECPAMDAAASCPTPDGGVPMSVDPAAERATSLVDEGQQTFRFDTFGDEAFWGEQLQLHE